MVAQVTETPTLRTLARQTYRESHSVKATKRLLCKRLRTDAALRESVVEEAIQRAVAEYASECRYAAIQSVKQNACQRDPAAMEIVARMRRRAFLDGWEINGIKLGDCTGSELEMQAVNEESRAAGHSNNARFYRQLAAICGENKVREKVADERAEELWSEIESGGQAISTLSPSAPMPASAGSNGHENGKGTRPANVDEKPSRRLSAASAK